MISWIQNHLIRHGRWIFLTLLALVIVAFVFTIGNTPGCTTDKSAYQEQKFYGIDLNAPREREMIIEKVSLSSYISGQQIRNDQQFQSQVSSRIAMLHLADEIGVPSPDQAALAEYIKTKAAFRGPDGKFSADAYTAFLDNLETNPRMKKELVALVIEEDYRIDQINSVVSGPGYVLPSEAKAQTLNNQTVLTLATAEIKYENFTPEIKPSKEDLTAFFNENTQRYEIPERIKASYVRFPATPSAEQTADLADADLRQHFSANRARFTPEKKTSEADTETPELTFEDVREAVVADLLNENALRAANEAAQSFAYSLYRDEIKRNSAAFNTLLNDSGATLTEIAPYTRDGAAQRALSAEMLQSAFALGANRYFSDAYPVDGGFAVLIYEDRIAPEVPAFESIEAELLADYQAEAKRDRFNQHGESLKAKLEARIADGTPFADAAAELDLGVNSHEPFKVAETPKALRGSALQAAQRMAPGEVSPMLVAGGIGTFVYLEKIELPEITADNEEFTQSKKFLAYLASSSSASALVNELVARGVPDTAKEGE